MSAHSNSIGKFRGYTSTTNSAGSFSILAFDHRQSFINLLNPENIQKIDYQAITAAKEQIVRFLATNASAVLLDPVFSAAQTIATGALPGNIGLIVSIEQTGYSGTETKRESSILPGWSVHKTKMMGADAVKLLVYYHPLAGEITEKQEQLIRLVINECRKEDILFFLEIVTYSHLSGVKKTSREFSNDLPKLIPEIASRLGALGPDVLKLEFPVNAQIETDESLWIEACLAVSEASPCPWALLSAASDFTTFSRQVEVACQAGASGFIAGRAIWQEAVPMRPDQRENWLLDIGASRLNHLNEIAMQHARPWRDFYPDLSISVSEDWYLNYGS